jgi:hypothetical protein
MPSAEVIALLGPVGWRENLVGAVATLAMEPRQRPLEVLWARIEGWSWVVPQLCVTASLADARFVVAQNTSTKRLTEDMLDGVFRRAQGLLGNAAA